MEKFLEAAAIAWNPIGEVRRRMQTGSLTVGSVLVPFIAIVVACNLFALGAQKFFMESVLYAAGGSLPDHPLLSSDFAQRFMSAIGVLAPVGAVALLPRSAFEPAGRSATVATMLVVAAAWAFYGAALSVPLYFIAGALATVNLELGWNLMLVLFFPVAIVILSLTLFFWLRITLSVLGLSGAQVAGISLVVLIALAVVVGLFAALGSALASPNP